MELQVTEKIARTETGSASTAAERRMRDLLVWLDEALPTAGIEGRPIYGGVAPVPGHDLGAGRSLSGVGSEYWTRLNDWLMDLRLRLGDSLADAVLVLDMPVRDAPTSAVFIPLSRDAVPLDGPLMSWLDAPTTPTQHALAPGMALPLGPLEDLGLSGVVVILDPAAVLRPSRMHGSSRPVIPHIEEILPQVKRTAPNKPPVLHCDVRGGHDRRMLELTMHLSHGEMHGLVAKVRSHEGTVARAFVSTLDRHRHTVSLHRPDGRRFGGGEHELIVQDESGSVLFSEVLRLRR